MRTATTFMWRSSHRAESGRQGTSCEEPPLSSSPPAWRGRERQKIRDQDTQREKPMGSVPSKIPAPVLRGRSEGAKVCRERIGNNAANHSVTGGGYGASIH
jgi:hypothetical protein